jgi:rhamnosyltransferase
MRPKDACQKQCHPEQGIVIPLYGPMPPDLPKRVATYAQANLFVVLVQNNLEPPELLPSALRETVAEEAHVRIIYNHNRGGVAGGFNRGIESALMEGLEWVTLLDQDSKLSAADFKRLLEPWHAYGDQRLLVGPIIWDSRREKLQEVHDLHQQDKYSKKRLLISSGTTFKGADWAALGPMEEWLIVDFVDHAWCFRAQERGFLLLQHPQVVLHQDFGHKHPHLFCHLMGMELYSPMRHFYSLRNLRWLIREPYVPLDLKVKEMLKMLLKPWFWLLFEPCRKENLKAIVQALKAPLPLLPVSR